MSQDNQNLPFYLLILNGKEWENLGKNGKEWENTFRDCCNFASVKASEPKGRHL
jgi:hypothetical protein